MVCNHNMTKLGLKYRLKLAMWSFYSDEVSILLHGIISNESEFLKTYNEQVNGLIGKIPQEYRESFKELLTLKAAYRVRMGSKVLNGTNTKLIDNVRLFEDISLKQHIERVERKEEEDKKREALKKDRQEKGRVV